eukprot:3562987-Amphidinium_carterae.2
MFLPLKSSTVNSGSSNHALCTWTNTSGCHFHQFQVLLTSQGNEVPKRNAEHHPQHPIARTMRFRVNLPQLSYVRHGFHHRGKGLCLFFLTGRGGKQATQLNSFAELAQSVTTNLIFVAVLPAMLVRVTVYSQSSAATSGVPLTTPVVALRRNPAH